MFRFIICVFYFGSCFALDHSDSQYIPNAKDGVFRCQPDALAMEVLPGGGFDALTNKELGRVLAVNFSTNSCSLDKKYLIPDFMSAIPVKQSHLYLSSQMIDHWQDYNSLTAKSINADASVHSMLFQISASFSDEHQSVKKNMIESKSVTILTQLRYTHYRIHSDPDVPINANCKSRLYDIASYIQRNDTHMASYLSQVFVRDFGTHVTTDVDAGALLVRTDQIGRDFVQNFDGDESRLKAAASSSFLGAINAGGSFSMATDQQAASQYQKNVKISRIDTIGGPAFRSNFTLSDWESGLDNGLVPVDRAGNPIWYAVTRTSLPELPTDTIHQLADSLKEAVRQYYLHNVHRGCTNPSAKNFDSMANLEDGQCDSPATNMTFGGVYQICEGGDKFCNGNTLMNPKTGKYSCPENYQAQLLNSIYEEGVGPKNMSAYWCYATQGVPQNSGYLFGGVYTDSSDNMITQDRTCPRTFYPLKLMTNMYVCISDDYELGGKYSYQFGGFSSCWQGNPLEGQSSVSAKPTYCPNGYSQHLVEVLDQCEINFCARKNAFGGYGLPVLKRPPFVSRPVPLSNDSMYLLTASKKVLKKFGDEWVYVVLEEKMASHAMYTLNPSSSSSGLSVAGIVSLSVFSTVLAALLVWVVIVMVIRYRESKPYSAGVAPMVMLTKNGGEPSSSLKAPINTETSRLIV